MSSPEVDVREDIPLKTGKKSTEWYYSCSEDCLGGSRFINVAFGTLTLVITVALLLQIYYGDYQIVPHGSVATDSFDCSRIGTSILKGGGNSVDAAIASAFCLAVVAPHVTSLDADGIMMIYNHRTRLPPNVIDFSSGRPAAAPGMPRLVAGLAVAHQHFGSAPWRELVRPAAALARGGFLVPKVLVQAATRARAEGVFGRLEPGQLLRLDVLADTLESIADTPEKDLYSSIESTSKPPRIAQASRATFRTSDIFVPSFAPSGMLLSSILEHIETFHFHQNDTVQPEYLYRIAEVAQLLYKDLNETYSVHDGTSSNVAVIDLNDNYVSLITGLYKLFGSGEMTSNGYVIDVQNKEQTCSRIPLIVVNREVICGRRIVLGANDPIIASQLLSTLLIAEENVTETIEAPRFHILFNDSIGIEASHIPMFNEDVLKYLETLTSSPLIMPEPYFSSNVVEKIQDDLSSHSDSRGGGIASRF